MSMFMFMMLSDFDRRDGRNIAGMMVMFLQRFRTFFL
jgi:hypothetical protein